MLSNGVGKGLVCYERSTFQLPILQRFTHLRTGRSLARFGVSDPWLWTFSLLALPWVLNGSAELCSRDPFLSATNPRVILLVCLISISGCLIPRLTASQLTSLFPLGPSPASFVITLWKAWFRRCFYFLYLPRRCLSECSSAIILQHCSFLVAF